MAALLVGLSVMAVFMSMALPVWSHHMKREREEELIWRGQQYARAVGLFQRKYANTFPPTINILVEQRFLRKKYKDPITNDDFMPIPAGGGSTPGQMPASRDGARPGASAPTGFTPQRGATPGGGTQGGAPPPASGPQAPSIGIQGVVSKSKDPSIKIYNGRTKYNEWAFVYLATTQRVGPGGTTPFPGQQPGALPGQRPGFNPQGQQGGRPPVPFPMSPGQPPGSGPTGQQPSPFSPPGPMGSPRPGPPPRPPGV